MLQYLLNATAIWLLSLVVFDVFLRREAFHGYNRLYLLATFALGLLLPLYSWQPDSIVYSSGLGRPVIEQTAIVKQGIVASGTSAFVLSIEALLWGLYLSGAFISLLFLLKEVFVLIGMYRKGDKSKDGVWTIVETGKEHTPFSAFRIVFISSRKNYDAGQLQIILSHEEQHGHLLHFIDLVFIQLAKIVFWFHPLAYIYHSRLMIVHEYQADAAVDKAPAVYGHFLVEQAILGPAPALSHTFNRTPIKKRILMLTRKSSALSKSKTLVAVPLILICILCFTKNAFSDDKRVKDGNKITYRGNVIEMKEWGPDTVMVQNPSTGEIEIRIIRRDPSPVILNGKKIYTEEKIPVKANKMGGPSNTTSGFTDKGLKEYLLTSLKDELKKLKDGNYYLTLSNIIIDEKGGIVYFDYGGISASEFGEKNVKTPTMGQEQQDVFARKIVHLLHNAPKHIAATVNGEYVPSLMNNADFWNPFIIKNGELTAL